MRYQNEFDEKLGTRKAIYVPFPQAVPLKYAIDEEHCLKCELCMNVCKAGAVDFNQKPDVLNIDVGAIILAPGFEEFDPRLKSMYGYGRYPNVVSSIEFERTLSASGPYGGNVNEGLLNMVEMAFRAYDPCFACATHFALGQMPLEVNIYDHNKNLLKVIKR